MADRREEKYLIGYADFARISAMAKSLMHVDPNGVDGRYSICSIYYDDIYDTTLFEKEDGNAVHTKYRIRTYGGDLSTIKLERKVKKGIITSKLASSLAERELDILLSGGRASDDWRAFDLCTEIHSKGLKPVCAIRYDRLAFLYEPLNIRLTFDINIDRLPPDKLSLAGDMTRAIPAIPRGEIVMEVKYDKACPSFVRKICQNAGQQISVSKYALCRNARV